RLRATRAEEFGKRRAIAPVLARKWYPSRVSYACAFRALVAFLCVYLTAVITQPVLAHPADHPSPVTVQGRLSVSPGKKPFLKTATKDYPLGATASYVLHTLQDNRLNGKEIRAEGLARPDGSFQVDKFFTVRQGKLYRVRYYCETCNIVAQEPGRCECCQ